MPIRVPLYKFLKEDGNSMNFSRRSLCRFSPSYPQGIVFDVPLPQNLMPFPPPPPPGESEILLILILLIVMLKRKMHGKEEELE